MTDAAPLFGAALVAGATCARVYRGGVTLNDHAVAAMVTGCIAIWPIVWLGAVQAGAAHPLLAAVLAVGAVSQYGLFHVLDQRRDAGPSIWVARLAQPAYAFSLWTGLLLILHAPWAILHGGSVLWPGRLLWIPATLALWGTAWTYLAGRAVRRYTLPLATLPRPVRVVHLSDVHASPTMRRADLFAMVARTNAQRPDLVVVTGDLVMPFSEDEHDALLDALASIEAPTICCPGNHDLPIRDRLRDELAARGVRLLVDERVVIDVGEAKVEVVGVDFHWVDAKNHLGAALAALPPAHGAQARLLLAHDPRLFRWVPEGRFDLVLSGHTHGGQVGTDMFGVPWSVLRPMGVLDQGWWRRGATRLYVHRGNWQTGLPPRMGIASEVVAVDLGGEGEGPTARPA